MASTTALFSGLSGLNANSRMIEVIGNNISNVNTTAYKSNRVLFSSTFNRTFSIGSAPAEHPPAAPTRTDRPRCPGRRHPTQLRQRHHQRHR